MNVHTAAFEMAAGISSQLPQSSLPEVAFSGRSNVGKSSLINRLVNRKSLARTSATPGKTATINFYKLDTMRMVDLPGYGYAKVSDSERRRWSELIEGYFDDDRDLRLVVQLWDMRHAPSKDDYQMLNYMIERGTRKLSIYWPWWIIYPERMRFPFVPNIMTFACKSCRNWFIRPVL